MVKIHCTVFVYSETPHLMINIYVAWNFRTLENQILGPGTIA